jgi:hypothetical protein
LIFACTKFLDIADEELLSVNQIFNQSLSLKYFYNSGRVFYCKSYTPPLIANKREENPVAFIPLEIFGKPGMEIAGAVKPEFAGPDGSFFDDDFFNIGKEHQFITLKHTVAFEQNTFTGNGDQ